MFLRLDLPLGFESLEVLVQVGNGLVSKVAVTGDLPDKVGRAGGCLVESRLERLDLVLRPA